MAAAAENVRHWRTERLAMRPVARGDAGFMRDLFALPELVAHRPHPVPDSAEASARRLARDLAHWDAHDFGRWVLERDGAAVGFGGLTLRPDVAGLNISYHLHPAHWRNGYAREFVHGAVRVAFADLRAPRVAGMVRSANPASQRVLEAAGFEFESLAELDGAPTRVLALYAPG